MKYRKEIDGLRAIAVIPVILFHAGLVLFQGGFLGVDVFFVISGYLITTIIITEIENKKFSFLNFYNRRIRRIVPALFAMLLVVTIVSPFFMTPNNLKTYGESLVATLLSANNILLYYTSGYWSIATCFKPLFHTWSLGVEEQYYFLIPILLCFLSKISASKKYYYFFTAVIIFSLIASFSVTSKDFVFLMLFTRAWEIGLGSLLSIYMLREKTLQENRYLSLIGLSLIIISYIVVSGNHQLQTLFNLVPVIGALLVIRYHTENSIGHSVLTSKPFCFIGLISYSVYLWHQPLFAFLNLYSEYPPQLYLRLLMALLSIPLGYFSWKYIERPCRNGFFSDKVFYTVISFLFIAGLIAGFTSYATFGFQSLTPKLSYGVNPGKYNDSVFKLEKNNFPVNHKKNILVIGDSFARDFVNMIRQNVSMSKLNINYLPDYVENEKLTIHLLSESNCVIYVSSDGLDGYFPNNLFSETKQIDKFLTSHTHAPVYIVGTKNFGWNNNFLKHISLSNTKEIRVRPLKPQITANKIMEKAAGKNYIDIFKLIVDKNGKVPIYDNTNHIIAFDTNHLTKYGAKFIGKLLINKTALSKIFAS